MVLQFQRKQDTGYVFNKEIVYAHLKSEPRKDQIHRTHHTFLLFLPLLFFPAADLFIFNKNCLFVGFKRTHFRLIHPSTPATQRAT